MSQRGYANSIFRTVLSILLLLFLGVLIWQQDAREEKLIQLYKDHQELSSQIGRTQQKMDALTQQIRAGVRLNTSTGSAQSSGRRKFLHPEVKNVLEGIPPKEAPPEANTNGVLHKVYAFQGTDPKGMNFIIENSAGLSEDIQEYVSMFLAGRSPSDPSKFYPLLAQRVEVTDDSREYTIYLRKGVKWHKPVVDFSNKRYEWLKGDRFVTAHDIKYTVDLILNPAVQAAHIRNYYQDIENVRVLDDHTLIIRWKKKTYQSFSFTLGLWPTPRWLYGYDEDGQPFPSTTAGLKFNEHWYNNRAIGCGPYQFVKWRQQEIIELKRFEEFNGKKPPIQEIHLHMIRDKNQQLLNFQSGLLDLHELPVAQYRENVLEAPISGPYRNGTYNVHTVTKMVYRYIGWNLDDYRFKDPKVRRAMTHAIDRDFVVKNVLNGLGTVTTGSFYRHSNAYDETLKPWKFDLDEASRLLEEAGWKDEDKDGVREKKIDGKLRPLEFPLLIYGYRPEVRSWSTLLKENLYKIGVRCTLVPVEWSVMLKRMEDREFIAYTGGWGLDYDGDPYQIWHSSQADQPKSSNRIGFRNTEADKIIEKLRETFDPDERVKLQHQFHAILHKEQPYSFLYSEKNVVALQQRVKNVSFQKMRPHVQTMNWYIQ
jgi:peptide/nickel transport system substrate-binding protein